MPRKRLPWIKLWFEMLGDPKMTRLTLAERGCWHEILLLAGQSPIRGKLMLTEIEPMTMDDIARALSLTPDEYPVLESCVQKLIQLNSLHWNEHRCLEVTHFIERQDKYPSDFQDYHKKSPDKFLHNSVNTPEKLLKEEEGRGKRGEEEQHQEKENKEEEKEEEKEKENNEITPKGARRKRATQSDPRVKEIFNEIHKFLGYPDKVQRDPIPNYGREGQFIKKMLGRGFTCVEILSCWKSKVSQRGGEYVSMVWVNEDIGKSEKPTPGPKKLSTAEEIAASLKAVGQ
ncbi:MAG: hypothetical protein ACUVTR_02165 [Dehalococcoidia bacterium]